MILPRLILVFAVMALSQAGNLIRLCDAPPVSIAFYRLFFAFALILPLSARTIAVSIKSASARTQLTTALMAATFATHLLAWIDAVQKTTVANSAICFAISPVFTALGARWFLREHITRRITLAIAAGIIGLILVSSGDFSVSPRHFAGDLLALLSGFLFSVYCLLGKSLRERAPNLFIMPTVYALGAMLTASIALTAEAPLSGFNLRTWTGLALLACFPTILGHASLIYVMRFFKASTISTALLLEPVLAGVGALFAFHENLTVWSMLGYLCIAGGLLPMFLSEAPHPSSALPAPR